MRRLFFCETVLEFSLSKFTTPFTYNAGVDKTINPRALCLNLLFVYVLYKSVFDKLFDSFVRIHSRVITLRNVPLNSAAGFEHFIDKSDRKSVV